MTAAEIEPLLKEQEEDLLTEKPWGIKRLGIDEITQLKGGKNYAPVWGDLDPRKPLTILEKRNKEGIAKYLSNLGWEVLEQRELDQKRKKEKRAAEKIKNQKQREQKLAGIKNSKYPC